MFAFFCQVSMEVVMGMWGKAERNWSKREGHRIFRGGQERSFETRS